MEFDKTPVLPNDCVMQSNLHVFCKVRKTHQLLTSSRVFLKKEPSFASMLTDTHTHLYSDAFTEDRDAMMQRARDAGVKRFFIPAIDSGYTNAMYDLESNTPKRSFL